MNKQAQLAFNAVLALAVGVLYLLHFTSKSGDHAAPAAAPTVVATAPEAPAETAPTAAPAPAAPALADTTKATGAGTGKIAFVLSGRLMEEYKGAQAARKQLEAKLGRLQKQHEAAVAAFQSAVQQYQARAGSMLDGQRREQEEKLQQQEMQVAQQQQALQQQAAEEEAKVNEVVLTKVNKLLETYGKERGYDFILIAGNGNVAYGRKAFDITDEILRQLNK